MRHAISVVLLFLAFPLLGNAQKKVQTIDLHLGYSRDVSKQPNILLNGAFNERQAGNGNDKGFNGVVGSVMFNLSSALAVKVEAASHFSTGTVQTGIVHTQGNSSITISGGHTKIKRASLLGGLQVKREITGIPVTPFGSVMAGFHVQSLKIKNSDASVDDLYGSDKVTAAGPAIGLGAGVDVKLTDKLDLRAVQVNYNINFIGDKMLTKESSPWYGSGSNTVKYTVERDSQRQKQLTVGIGIVYHL